MTTIAFVGCAHIHTPGFIKAVQKRDDIKVKSVWDHDPTRAKKRAAKKGGAASARKAKAKPAKKRKAATKKPASKKATPKKAKAKAKR